MSRTREADIYGADGTPVSIVMFNEGLYDVPNLAMRLGPKLDTSKIPSPYSQEDGEAGDLALESPGD